MINLQVDQLGLKSNSLIVDTFAKLDAFPACGLCGKSVVHMAGTREALNLQANWKRQCTDAPQGLPHGSLPTADTAQTMTC